MMPTTAIASDLAQAARDLAAAAGAAVLAAACSAATLALGTRVLVLGLAAMSLNFLLGFTGVLSFGHAAYFGLGAYGTGLALKCWSPEHAARAAARRRSSAASPARCSALLHRASARRLLRHGDDRLRPGVLLHRVSLELADRRRRRVARLRAPAAGFRRRGPSTSCTTAALFYYFVLALFALAVER